MVSFLVIAQLGLLIFLIFVMESPVYGQDLDPNKNVCGQYIKEISQHLKIIPEIVWAVSKTESNYKGAPWPWTANFRGKPYYFKNQEELKSFIKKLPKKQREDLDIGCMQINYRYHGWKFNDIIEMTDPQRNMILGSLYLYELYLKEKIYQLNRKRHNQRWKIPDDLHIWAIAVGRYHSHRQKNGKKYVRAVTKHLKPKPSLHTPGIVYDIDVLDKKNEIQDIMKEYKYLLKTQKVAPHVEQSTSPSQRKQGEKRQKTRK